MSRVGRPAAIMASGLVIQLAGGAGCRAPDDALEEDAGAARAFRAGTQGLRLATWNIEWLGSGSKGPPDEERQLANVVQTLQELDADLVAVQEVVSDASFDAVLSALGDRHDGLLAGDGWVRGGSSYSAGEQQVGFIWRRDRLELVDAEVVLQEWDQEFAGRPPLLARFEVDGQPGVERVALTLHAKARADLDAWRRRQAGADALQHLLEGPLRQESVALMGDLNDDIDESIVTGRPSPYADLRDAFRFATLDMSLAGVATMDRGSHTLDHILLTGDWDPSEDADAERVQPAVERFSQTTSDHFPVAVQLAAAGDSQAGSAVGVILNEVLANETGTDPGGEFVELFHAGDGVLDLGGWMLADADRTRHVFEAGVLLAPGDRVVIWGGDASEGGLGLGNSGDAVRLSRPDGTLADEVRYGRGLAEADGVSMVRAVDGDPQALWVSHDTVASGPSSPGWGAGEAMR